MLAELADAFWLMAHDTVSGQPCIGDWPRGVGLGTALLAELMQHGWIEVRDGELFRTTHKICGDAAQAPLLRQIAEEERTWRHGNHRQPGHPLKDWISYLAYEKRAEDLVIARLKRQGLVREETRRRLLRRPKSRYMPSDSNVAFGPAPMIISALRRGYELHLDELVLAGLLISTGLYRHTLVTLNAQERSGLDLQLGWILGQKQNAKFEDLLVAAKVAVGEAAMRSIH